VLGFTRALAAELGKDGVCVNAIGPGLIETPLDAEVRQRPRVGAHLPRAHPAWTHRHARGYRRPALLLASDLSRYVTGAIVMVDGSYRTI